MTQMRTDYTAIALVVDRSGSMQSVAEDTKGGIKQFIADQKKNNAGKASLTLVQFDHEYQILNSFSDLKEIDENAFANQYQPRGSTALLDAIGRTIIEMNAKIKKMAEAERPNRVVVAIITDGQENSSREFTTVDKVKKLIEENKTWDFMFLGADLNAISVAQTCGFDVNKACHYNASNVSGAFSSIGQKVSDARNGQEVQFSSAERSELAKEKPLESSFKLSFF